MPARSDKTFVVGLSSGQAIELAQRALQGVPATIQNTDEQNGILLATKEASTQSWGENIRVSIKQVEEKACQIHVEVESSLSTLVEDQGASQATVVAFESQLTHLLSEQSLPPPLAINIVPRPAVTPPPTVSSVPVQPANPAGVYLSRPPKDRSTAMLLEILPALFGIFGIGWLYSGNTSAGLTWLIGVLVWDVIAIIIDAATGGFGFICTIPIAIILLIVSAVSLSNYTKRRQDLFGL
jgi:hypothetical protein